MADDGWRSANRREVMTRDWWFRDRGTGEIVIAQFPNVALWIFLGSVVVRAFVADGTPTDSVAAWVGAGALTWWALDEVIRGVNPWRRVLGIGGCGFAIARVISLIS